MESAALVQPPGGPPPDGTPLGERLTETPEEIRVTVQSALGSVLRSRSAIIGLSVIVLVVLFSFVGPHFWHTNQVAGNLLLVNMAPGSRHPLGTDNMGFDILGRMMVGGQSSIEIGCAVALVSTTFGTLYGAIAGYVGGFLDSLLMRVVDSLFALPSILIFVYLASVFRPTILLLVGVLSALAWLGPARLLRGESLVVKTRDFVQAARVMGGRTSRIVGRHIIPNCIGVVVVNATFQVADAILMLATLSFLGFGLPPPAVTWGGMLANGVNFLADGYWWQVWPALGITVVFVVAVNFLGDAVREAFVHTGQR